MGRFPPFCWHDEQFNKELAVARTQNYSVQYCQEMRRIQSLLLGLASRWILSN